MKYTGKQITAKKSPSKKFYKMKYLIPWAKCWSQNICAFSFYSNDISHGICYIQLYLPSTQIQYAMIYLQSLLDTTKIILYHFLKIQYQRVSG